MDEGKKNFWVFEFPPLLWMGIIFCLSSIPGRYVPRSWLFHHAGHFIEYSVLGVLLARAMAHLKIKWNVLMFSFLSVVLIILYALFDEWRQSFVPGRTCSLNTVFFDAAYAILGVVLYDEIVFVLRKKKRTGNS